MENPTLRNSRELASRLLSYTGPESQESARREAEQIGKRNIYVPCSLNALEVATLMMNPSSLELSSSNNSTEPVYGSFERALQGRNPDGTKHKAFAVIESWDYSPDCFIDYVDREKDSVLPSNIRSQFLRELSQQIDNETQELER